MSAVIEVRIPNLGDLAGADVVEISAEIGAEVAAESVLLQLESEKALMEVTSPANGRLTELLVRTGDRVTSGQLVARLAGDDASAAASVSVAEATVPPASTATPPPPPAVPAAAPAMQAQTMARAPATPAVASGAVPAGARIYAGPAARRLARELGVDLHRVQGSGPRGRILSADVKAHVRNRPAVAAAGAAPVVPLATEADFEKFGRVDYEPLARIQKISARRLANSWSTIPHVTQHEEADITALEAERLARKEALKERGINLTLLAFLMRATVIALGEMPRFNSSLCPDGERIALKRYCHVGFAADTPVGLTVPVIRDADRKDLFEIAGELGSLSAKARAGKLTPADMQGSTFTLSSLGGVGGTHFTPIVNPPEVAILGAGRAKLTPTYVGSQVQPRLILPLSLSYDHRVIDGVAGVRFIGRIAALLADPQAVLAAVP